MHDINIQLWITLIVRNFSRGQTLSMDRDCVDSAEKRAGGIFVGDFDRCAGASSDAGVPVYEHATVYCPSASFNQ